MPNIFISYSRQDFVFAKELAAKLKAQEVNIWIDQFNILPGKDSNFEIEKALQSSDTLIAILSPASVESPFFLNEISKGLQANKRIIPILLKDCEIPVMLRNRQFIDFTKNFEEGFIELRNSLTIHKTQSVYIASEKRKYFDGKKLFAEEVAPAKPEKINMPNMEPYPAMAAPGNKGTIKNFFRNILSMLTPAGNFNKRDRIDGVPVFKKMARPEIDSSRGRILYDIPDNMQVKKQTKCVVRVGKNDLIVKADDKFTEAMVTEDIILAGVMKAELIDIAEPPNFVIKPINSAEQEVDTESKTEWTFYVTPLQEGSFPLILKVSAIKIIDGKERRKEIVFEKLVNITAGQVGKPAIKTEASHLSFATSLQAGKTETTGFSGKNLMDESSLKEFDPPVAFLSYAHKDKLYFDIFIDYLKSQSGWSIWTDKNIEIGSDWYDRIQQSVKDSDMALLLVSSDFLSSAFIKEHEFSKFIQLKEQKKYFIFLPVLLRDVDFTRWKDLAKMQFFVAYANEYGIPDKSTEILPFARLCNFSNDNQLIPNAFRDTYFKNFVKKAETDWLKSKLNQN